MVGRQADLQLVASILLTQSGALAARLGATGFGLWALGWRSILACA